MIVVLTTAGSSEEAEKLAKAIVERRLAACVQILPRMTSVYFWQGEVRSEGEHLLLIKTLDERFNDLSLFIRENHSYDVPEIAAIDAEKVSQQYLDWLTEYVRG
jgi:periplasmic divalent cation tolerance protein